jgi:hypothetical protein
MNYLPDNITSYLPYNITDFQTTTLQLSGSYSSQTVAHAGYVVAIAVAIAAILYQVDFKTFFKDFTFWKRVSFFYIPLNVLIGSVIMVFCRMIYWAWMSSSILVVPYENITNTLFYTNLSYTPSFLIQNYTTSEFFNLNQTSIASRVCLFTYHSINNYFLVALCFGLILFVAIISADIVYSRPYSSITPLEYNIVHASKQEEVDDNHNKGYEYIFSIGPKKYFRQKKKEKIPNFLSRSLVWVGILLGLLIISNYFTITFNLDFYQATEIFVTGIILIIVGIIGINFGEKIKNNVNKLLACAPKHN